MKKTMNSIASQTIRVSFATALLSSSAFASMAYVDTGTLSYDPATTPTIDIDARPDLYRGTAWGPELGAYEGLIITTGVSQAGTLRANGNAIVFTLTDAMVSGESITFDFNFNMQLASGLAPDGTTYRRAAFYGRLNSNQLALSDGGPMDTTASVTMGGGTTLLNGGTARTQQDMWGTASPPSIGDKVHDVGQSNYSYNDIGTGLDGDGQNGEVGTSLFNGWTNGGNTSNFIQGDVTHHFGVMIRDRGHKNTDVNYDHWSMTFTNNATGDIPIGAEIRFTIDGVNEAGQVAVAVPEPSGLVILALGSLVFIRRLR